MIILELWSTLSMLPKAMISHVRKLPMLNEEEHTIKVRVIIHISTLYQDLYKSVVLKCDTFFFLLKNLLIIEV